MDPTSDPNFLPPSRNHDFEPPAPLSQIPTNMPIQPLVLADLGSEVDAPAPHPLTRLHKEKEPLAYHLKIPRRYNELMNSLSDEDQNGKHEEDHKNHQDGEHKEQPLGEQADGHKTLQLQPMKAHVAQAAQTHKPILPPTIKVRSTQIADLEEVPHGIQRQAKSMSAYSFPTHRLATSLRDDSKYPLVVVACGLFSPITYLHLRMFEMALDAISEQTRFEVIGGYYSPVSDNYKKQGLAPAHHRVRMCELACERTSLWLMVDAWELLQPRYTRTALVLDHFNEEVNIKRGGIRTQLGEQRGVKIMLLAGGDLIESMGEPDVWADQDLHHILGKYGCLIVERTGSDVRSFLLSHDIMYEHRRNVLVIKQLIYNDISSTKIRLFIRRGMLVQYLLPNSVIRYIQEHRLYINDTEPVKQVMNDKGD